MGTIGLILIGGVALFLMYMNEKSKKERALSGIKKLEQEFEEDRLKRISYREKREFAKKYENTIFQMFASSTNKPSKLGYLLLEKVFVIHEIQRLENVSKEDARKIFDLCIENDVFYYFWGRFGRVDVGLGSTLGSYWDVCSYSDMNLKKWCEQHPNRETWEDQVRRRVGIMQQYYPCYTFDDFEKKFGVLNRVPPIHELKFGNSDIIVMNYKGFLGFEKIYENKDQLYVYKVDDKKYRLERVWREEDKIRLGIIHNLFMDKREC